MAAVVVVVLLVDSVLFQNLFGYCVGPSLAGTIQVVLPEIQLVLA